MRKLWANQEAVVRKHAVWACPEGKIPVDENVSRAVGCTFGGSDRVHFGSPSKTIEEQDVGVTSRRDRKGDEVIHADGNAGPFLQGHRYHGLTDRPL